MKMTAWLGAALAALFFGMLIHHPAVVGQAAPAEVLFTDVRVFDGTSDALSPPTDVLVRGNVIAAIGGEASSEAGDAMVIEGRGRTLMPA